KRGFGGDGRSKAGAAWKESAWAGLISGAREALEEGAVGRPAYPAMLDSAARWRPRTAGPHPVVILIHGGPESQYRPGWDPLLQFMVNELGYAVVAPNVRGSSGYGKSFLALDNGPLREDAVRDVGSLLVWIGVQPHPDRDRVRS